MTYTRKSEHSIQELRALFKQGLREIGATAYCHQERVKLVERYVSYMLDAGYSLISIHSVVDISMKNLKIFVDTREMPPISRRWSRLDFELIQEMRSAGMSNRDIDKEFGLPEHTIVNRYKRLCEKYGSTDSSNTLKSQ